MKHLSDEQIQEYLEGGTGTAQQKYHAHLQTCEQCRQAVAHYRRLFTALAFEPTPELSPSFTDTLMLKIAADSSTSSQTLEWVLFAISAVAGLAITIYLMVASFSQQQLFAIGDSVRSLFSFFGTSSLLTTDNAHLFLFALIVLAIISAMDKLLLQRKA